MFDSEARVVAFLGTPRCTDSDTYSAWLDAARKSPPDDAGFCGDCTPDYQKDMMKLDRCENPWIKFMQRESGVEKTTHNSVSEENPEGVELIDVLNSLSNIGIAGYIPTEYMVKRWGGE